ncbi:NAD(P)-dependent alcohol dehydrogenase [Actinoplanes sp. Pm04-4]|uniref:alcohol dehydrogenase (NADP(+)) n=1 Tax=Paractinoplanes pyxinae TaxID=2997416 RepID=A0ABT4B2V9_9ACTN|nr:NAD(P)-dependent alcohol dehydrogenase [Actinoplanes pyxinae]MCY1140838.1 NAD(P)-dependent alcohol dehydrogenase [Actinoplanes pyxinae]
MKVRAFAAHEAGAVLQPFQYEAGPLGRLEVDVRVTHCGVCHSDLGLIDDEFGQARYPVVAGHEAVGVVEAVGADVDPADLPVGTRVGVGAIAGSCFRCEWCLRGQHQFCPERDDTVLRGSRGGFAEYVRASDWRHVYPIPDAIGSAEAAPMLCAGTTVFAQLVRHKLSPTDRVAVVGVGGLGHLALQFAAAWGCHVTAISSSRAKEDDASRFGAAEVIVGGAFDGHEQEFDFILSTVSADLPWDEYLGLLKPAGVLSVVGVPPGKIEVGAMALLPQAKTLVGGVPGSVDDTRMMLAFAARHGVRPVVETFAMAESAAALDRVRKGSARYRVVLGM